MIRKIPLIFCLVIVLGSNVHAADSKNGSFFSVTGGIAIPNQMSGTFAWGLDACIRLGSVVCPLLAVGRYAVSADYGNTTSVTYGQSGSSVMYYATGANFFFYPNVITGLLLGLEKGSQNISVTSTASASTLTYEGSSSSFFAAPKVGYYYPWGMFSGGGELIYLFGLSSDSPKALILFASIKIWF